MKTNDNFKKWALSFAGGFDGGNIGNKNNPTIWTCGIEWGGEFDEFPWENTNKESFKHIIGYKDWKEAVKYHYGWNLAKLLAAIDEDVDYNVKNYKEFAKEKNLWLKNGNYFKLNLFPIAFKKTDKSLWTKRYSSSTGFENKEEYKDWIKSNRFPFLNELVLKHIPKAVICTGKTYKGDFIKAFSDSEIPDVKEELVGDRKLFWHKNEKGTYLFIVPFPGARYGLNSNVRLQKMGERIREIIS